MIGKVISLIVIFFIGYVAYQLYIASVTYERAIYLKIPEVSGVNRSCIYNNIVDVVESTFEGILFTADELISLSCFDSRNYTVEIYLNVNPSDEVVIDGWMELREPEYNISGRGVYILPGFRFLYKDESTLVFLTFDGFSTSDALSVVADSINERNNYELSEAFLLLTRIPEQSSLIDSSIYQRQVYISEELTTVLKGWYVGTSRLASKQAFVFLRKPGDIVPRCWYYNNESTPYGNLYLCYANNSCGPKYLYLQDAIAYAQDFDDMNFTCSSVEDAFTTDIMRNVR